jgi:hypothetical protein
VPGGAVAALAPALGLGDYKSDDAEAFESTAGLSISSSDDLADDGPEGAGPREHALAADAGGGWGFSRGQLQEPVWRLARRLHGTMEAARRGQEDAVRRLVCFVVALGLDVSTCRWAVFGHWAMLFQDRCWCWLRGRGSKDVYC